MATDERQPDITIHIERDLKEPERVEPRPDEAQFPIVLKNEQELSNLYRASEANSYLHDQLLEQDELTGEIRSQVVNVVPDGDFNPEKPVMPRNQKRTIHTLESLIPDAELEALREAGTMGRDFLDSTVNIIGGSLEDAVHNFLKYLYSLTPDSFQKLFKQSMFGQQGGLAGVTGTEEEFEQVRQFPHTGGMVEEIARSIGAFAWGMKGSGILLNTKKAMLARGAISDMVVFDPDDGNLATLIRDMDWGPQVLQNMAAYIDSTEPGTDTEKRLRMAAEGIILSGVLNFVIKSPKAMREFNEWRKTFFGEGGTGRPAVDKVAELLSEMKKKWPSGTSFADYMSKHLGNERGAVGKPTSELPSTPFNKFYIKGPWDKLIAAGEKTLETRGRRLPDKYIGKTLVMKNENHEAVGEVVFKGSRKIETKEEFDNLRHQHLVPEGSAYDFGNRKATWVWEVERVKEYSEPQKIEPMRGQSPIEVETTTPKALRMIAEELTTPAPQRTGTGSAKLTKRGDTTIAQAKDKVNEIIADLSEIRAEINAAGPANKMPVQEQEWFVKEQERLNREYDQAVKELEALGGTPTVTLSRPKPKKKPKVKKKTKTEETGTLNTIYPEVNQAMEEQMGRMDPVEAELLSKNMKEHEFTPWAAATSRGLTIREFFDRAIEGRAEEALALANSKLWGKDSLVKYAMGKAFMHSKEAVLKFAESYSFIGFNRKAELDISGAFKNCNPSKDCAKFCYAAISNARPTELMKAEFTEWIGENYPEIYAKHVIGLYNDTPQGRAGLALRINDKGDLSDAQVKMIEAMNKAGHRIQIFSKRPDMLAKVPDFNLKMMSIDSSNFEMTRQHPEYQLAVTITDDMTPEMIAEINDRVAVYLPVNMKGGEVTRADVEKRFPETFRKMTKKLCPVDGGKMKTKPGTSFVNIVTKTAEPGLWTCTACDKFGAAGCFYGKNQTENVKKIKNQIKQVNK